MKRRLLSTLPLFFVILSLASPFLSASANLGDTCSTDGDCDAGLHCDGCGDKPGSCVLTKPYDPRSKGKDLPFNEYSWLTTHNSFAILGATSATGSNLITFTNQEDNITSQLNNGVRGLMLDMYDFQNDVWLCHSFGGQCYNYTAFQPAINTLKEIETFLEANPSEVITIFIEDYVKAPNALSNIFNASGLMKYWFPVDQMTKNGSYLPLIGQMIDQNHRLIVFTSKESKEASEGIAYEWNYVVENQYGDEGMNSSFCPNRAESSTMNTTSKSLVLMNYFHSNPNRVNSCPDNSAPLLDMLNACYNSSAKRWANFVAVDFYMQGDAPQAVDVANGHMVCGCDNFAYCKANATFGTCVVPKRSVRPPTAGQDGKSNAPMTDKFYMLLKVVTLTILLLLEFCTF